MKSIKYRLGWLLAGLLLTLGLSAAYAQDVTPDLTNLPLGDGKVSTSGPQTGYIFVCNNGDPNGGGAGVDGPWINSSAGTFDFTQKAVVDGDVAWPNHQLTITLDGDVRRITTNDLPDHTTGVYPIASGDDAYQYDRNPNSISEQTFEIDLPAKPTAADSPSCVPGGPIGVTVSGSVIFDGLDAQNRDAVAHETQDHCQGHPQQQGQYHYHNLSTCILDSLGDPSALVGYALDGFGIYGPRDASGKLLTNADLDECHGMTSEVEWDGQKVTMYHYVATYEYPYTIGCFRGTKVQVAGDGAGQPGNAGGNPCPTNGQPPANGQQPPPPNGGQPPTNGQPPNGQRPPNQPPPPNGGQPPTGGQPPAPGCPPPP